MLNVLTNYHHIIVLHQTCICLLLQVKLKPQVHVTFNDWRFLRWNGFKIANISARFINITVIQKHGNVESGFQEFEFYKGKSKYLK